VIFLVITSPLEWQMTAAQNPRAVLPVDTRESKIHFISPGLRHGSVESALKLETIPLPGWKRSARWNARIYRIRSIPAPLIVVGSLIDFERRHELYFVYW
jgi:hypothetical protein